MKLGTAVLIASALCTVLATRVFVSFDGQRAKIVRDPIVAEEGRVRVETAHDERAAPLAAPVAVIAVVRNDESAPADFSIVADGHPVCRVRVKARVSQRIDCAAVQGWVPSNNHVIEVVGASGAWALESLELATHHGSGSSPLPFVILPEYSTQYERPGAAMLVVAWLLIVGALLVPAAAGWHAFAVKTHLVLSCGVAVILTAHTVSPWVSPFLLAIPLGAFVKAIFVLLARRIWSLIMHGRPALERAFRHRPLWRPIPDALAIAAVVAVIGVLFVRHTVTEFDGNLSGLLRISGSGFDRSPLFEGRDDVRASLFLQPDEGYDAQFTYFAAFDPLLRRFRSTPERYRDVADAAPYRFGRIGFSWLVRVVSGGRWKWYPAAMVGLVLAGVALSAFVLARLAQTAGASALWGLIVLAMPGFWASVTMVLPEPLAAAFLLAGYWCVTTRRIGLAVAAFAMSLLIRETGVLFVAALAMFATVPSVTRRDRLWLLSALLPAVAWRVYVAAGFWPVWGWDGFFYPAPTLTMPFVGMAGLWSVLARGDYHAHVPELARAAIWLSVLLIAVAALSVGLIKRAGRFIGITFMVYAVMTLSFTYPTVWGHPANAQRASYEVFILLALASLGVMRYPRHLQVAVAACWAGAVGFILFGAHDSFVIWDALW